MDATTLSIIERITERYQQPQRVYSGHALTTFYNCALLNTTELSRLAAATLGDKPNDLFEIAVGLAYRGVLFAAALAHGRDVAILQLDGALCGPPIKGRRVLVVDDVIHSGNRIRKACDALHAQGAQIIGVGCIVDRSSGAAEKLGTPVFSAVRTDFC